MAKLKQIEVYDKKGKHISNLPVSEDGYIPQIHLTKFPFQVKFAIMRFAYDEDNNTTCDGYTWCWKY
jgi:hypothetical protein